MKLELQTYNKSFFIKDIEHTYEWIILHIMSFVNKIYIIDQVILNCIKAS